MPAPTAKRLCRLLRTQMTQKSHGVLKFQPKHAQPFVPGEKSWLKVNLGEM